MIFKSSKRLKHEDHTTPGADHSEHSGEGEGHDDESNWLVSYADMMTLLCGFFIMLFSMATLDQPKFEVVKEAISKEFGGKYTPPNENLEKNIKDGFAKTGLEKTIQIHSDPFGVTITFESTILFDTLSAEVTPEGRVAIEKAALVIEDAEEAEDIALKVVVEGHTDSRPVVGGSYPSNWELSGARAARVVRIFLEKDYYPEDLIAIGFADTRPLEDPRQPDGSWNEEALSKNRRVVIRVLRQTDDEFPGKESDLALYTNGERRPASSPDPEKQAK